MLVQEFRDLKDAMDADDVLKAAILMQGITVADLDTERYFSNGDVPVEYAVRTNKPVMLNLLIERGANTHICIFPDRPLMYYAAEWGLLEILELLLEAGADPNCVYTKPSNETALHCAVRKKQIESVQCLLSAGAYVGHLGDQNIPLHTAIYNRDAKMLNLLISAKADVNEKGKHDKTALHLACEMSNTNLLSQLVKAGAMLNEKNAEGLTPLIISTKQNNTELVQFLISSGADVNSQTNLGNTALHEAAQRGYLKLCEILIKSEADTSIQNSGGFTPAQIALINGYSDVALVLEGQSTSNPI